MAFLKPTIYEIIDHFPGCNHLEKAAKSQKYIHASVLITIHHTLRIGVMEDYEAVGPSLTLVMASAEIEMVEPRVPSWDNVRAVKLQPSRTTFLEAIGRYQRI